MWAIKIMWVCLSILWLSYAWKEAALEKPYSLGFAIWVTFTFLMASLWVFL